MHCSLAPTDVQPLLPLDFNSDHESLCRLPGAELFYLSLARHRPPVRREFTPVVSARFANGTRIAT